MMHLSGLRAFQNQRHARPLLCHNQVMVDRSHSQKRRDRNMRLIDTAVGQNQDVGILPERAVDVDIHALDRLLKAGVLVVGHRDHFDLEARALHVPDLHQIGVCQNRIVYLQHLAVFRLLLEEVAGLAQIDSCRCNNLLADRVNRRIGNLREELLEVVKQRVIRLCKHWKRRIDTHRVDRLISGQGHRQNGGLDFLIGIAEGLLHLLQHVLPVPRYSLIRNPQILQADHMGIDPLAVRLSAGIVLFQLFIIDHTPFQGVDQQHLARMKAFLDHNLLRRNRQHTDLRGENQGIVIRNQIAGRTQAVPVENSAHHIAICKYDGGWAVPRLHHRCVVLIKVLPPLAHRTVVVPWLRDRDHDSQRKRHPAHDQEFQRIVQHRRIRTALLDYRKDLRHLILEVRRRHILLACLHLVRISLDGIDLSVMDNEAVRMRPLPGRIGVR